MKRWRSLFHPVVVFILAQLAWLSLLGLWIYWYVSNYIIFNMVGDRISPKLISKSTHPSALILAVVLLMAILASMYLIFIYLNRQLQLTRLYDNFIANVTHELKSPLASIRLYLETLKMRTVPRKKQNEFYTLMIDDAHRLQNLIDSILEISGLEQKQIAHNFQVFNAQDTITSLVEKSAEQFKLPENTISITGSADCPFVVDRDAMKIVFDNLIDNAIKYSEKAPAITIDMSTTLKNVFIRIKDEGIGISAKDRKKVFQKFQRIYSDNNPNVKGTGLGLYWAREIIKYHGGRISVSSRGKNLGSTFIIELPIYRSSKTRYINYLLKLTKKNREKRNAGKERQSV
jgi:two-component system phosphate regulon sensor histidine kinase PhoR